MIEPRGALRYVAPVFRVEDMARALAFYRERLGFELDFLYEGSYGSVVRDGCFIHLQCAAPAPRDQAAFERNEHLDACLVIRNAEELFRSFGAAGVTFTVPLRRMPYGREFYLRDPDGYILGFIEPAP